VAQLIVKTPGVAQAGKSFGVSPGCTVRIGRNPDCELCLTDVSVSRQHATVQETPQGFLLTDLGSSRGTFVRGKKISAPVPLGDGDEIRFGSVCVEFQALDADTAVPPAVAPIINPANSKPVADFAVPESLYTEEVMGLKRRIHEQILSRLNLREVAAQQMEDQAMRDKLEHALDLVLKDVRHEIPQGVTPELLRQALLDELVAYGPITPMLRDATVTEIMINDAARVFIERKGLLLETKVRFFDDQHLMTIIRRIVEPLGRHVDESSPRVDARLPDGSRVNAIIPPVALDGPSLTIRKFAEKKLTSDDLIQYGSMTAPMAAFLEEAVRARQNILVSGGTGSGKTTLLNILSQFIPAGERLVTIEDSAELKLSHRNLIRLEARPANIEGRGRVSIQDLVINTLRMRPDRIIVGECRGAEALDMLQAMNTGHDGSLTTIHANNPRDSLARLETMVMMAGFDLPSRAIRDQVASAVNLVVQQSRLVDGSRKVVQISEITGREGDVILMQDIFVFQQTGFTKEGRVEGYYHATGNKPRFVEELAKKGDLRLDQAIFAAETRHPSGG
jgi:pilus assembly protein CpaF